MIKGFESQFCFVACVSVLVGVAVVFSVVRIEIRKFCYCSYAFFWQTNMEESTDLITKYSELFCTF